MTEHETHNLEILAAYLEGRLSGEACARLEEELAVSGPLRATCDALRPVVSELKEIGDCYKQRTPAIDITASVMARLHEADDMAEAPYLDRVADAVMGDLPPAEAESVINGHPNDAAWMRNAAKDLTAAGKQFAHRTGRVNVEEAVMAAIRGADAEPPRNTISFDRARVARLVKRAAWTGMAVAATLAMAVGLMQTFRPARTDQPLAPVAIVPTPQPAAPSRVEVAKLGLEEASEQVRQRMILPRVQPVEPSETFESVEGPEAGALDPKTVVQTRKEAAGNEEAWGKLQQWASLDEQEARTLLKQSALSPEVAIAAAEALPAEEREPHLLMAIGQGYNDPRAHLVLAETHAENGQAAMDVTAEETWSTVDPDNAYPYYLQARYLLDQGDIEGALELLNQAAALPKVDAYSLEAARDKVEALKATGMDADTAKLLAAFTAGQDEYDRLCDLGQDLLEYGLTYQEAGDLETAKALYESVLTLGEQIENGASFVSDQLAALDMQRASIEALGEVYTALEAVEGLEALTVQVIELLGKFEGINAFLSDVESFFATTDNTDLWTALADLFLQGGNIPLLDLFSDEGFDLTRFLQGFS